MVEGMRLALIDDDEAVLDALGLYFLRNGIALTCFSSADAFLASGPAQDAFDCIVADQRMPGMSGLDLVRHLHAQPGSPTVILITGHGDIDLAVQAMKAGAFDFVEKPFDEADLLRRTMEGAADTRERRKVLANREAVRSRIASLPTRQREVLNLAVSGLSNKEIALQLNISPRTVEGHRAWVMQRLGARNLADLIWMVMNARNE